MAVAALASLLSTATPAFAQAAVSNETGPASFTTTNQAFQFNHTVSGTLVPGSERVLVLAVSTQSVDNNGTSFAVTTAEWDSDLGAAQAFQSRVVRPLTNQAHRTRTEIWTLRDPVGGSGVIRVNLLSNADVVAGAVTLVNIDPNAPLTTAGSDLASGGSTSVTITTAPGGIVIDNIADDRVRPLAAASGQDPLWIASHNGTITGGASAKPAAGAGTSTTVTWSGHENGDKGGLVAISFGGVLGTTAVRLDSFTAAQFSQGTSLKWNTGWESNNLGFNVYREDMTGRVKLNDALIAGGAILTRGQLSAGHSYSWVDSGTTAQAYWLEDVDIRGKSTWHGPFKPYVRSNPLPGVPSPTLRDVGTPSAGGGKLARSRSLKSARRRNAGVHLQVAKSGAIKIGVAEDGWHSVSADQLGAFGFPQGVLSRLLRLFVEGREVPALVADGGDGRFGAGDSIQFYGIGLETAYTDERVYWLTVGPGAGLRIPTLPGGAAPNVQASFPSTVELREKTFYFSSLLNGDAPNHFGSLVYGAGTDQILNLPNVAPAQQGLPLLEVGLQGMTALEGSPDHRVAVQLNGVQVGEVVFDGQARGVLAVPVSATQIQEGANVVRLVPLAGAMDISFVESIRITYSRTFSADGNRLQFLLNGGQRVTVDGFTRGDVTLLDVSNPDAPRLVAGTVQQNGSGFSVTAANRSGAPVEILALTGENFQVPSSFRLNSPSALTRLAQSVDLLIIGPQSFHPELQALKTLRRNQGISAALIDIEDVYDEFSFGERTPYAVRDFLAQARRNAPKGKGPRFVLLVGDASTEPAAGGENLVPTKLIDTQLFETASDDWFVDFNADGIPDMAIGRLPVSSLEQVRLVVSKIVAYETGGPVGGTLVVSDANNGFDFESTSDAVANTIRGGATAKIYRGQGATSAELVNALNQGYSIVNYVGHGSSLVWPGLFNTDAAAKLTNGNRLSFVVAMNCMNGRFQNPNLVSMAEALLTAPQGGAVAVWASSGQCVAPPQAVMNQAFYQTLFSGRPQLAPSMTLGEAAMRAKASISDADVRRTWVFFGDPTSQLK